MASNDREPRLARRRVLGDPYCFGLVGAVARHFAEFGVDRRSAPSGELIAYRLFKKAVTAVDFPFLHERIHCLEQVCRERYSGPKSFHASISRINSDASSYILQSIVWWALRITGTEFRTTRNLSWTLQSWFWNVWTWV